LRGGLPVIEITLRTDAAMEAISAIKAAHSDLCVGAGTVRSDEDIKRAEAAGTK